MSCSSEFVPSLEFLDNRRRGWKNGHHVERRRVGTLGRYSEAANHPTARYR